MQLGPGVAWNPACPGLEYCTLYCTVLHIPSHTIPYHPIPIFETNCQTKSQHHKIVPASPSYDPHTSIIYYLLYPFPLPPYSLPKYDFIDLLRHLLLLSPSSLIKHGASACFAGIYSLYSPVISPRFPRDALMSFARAAIHYSLCHLT